MRRMHKQASEQEGPDRERQLAREVAAGYEAQLERVRRSASEKATELQGEIVHLEHEVTLNKARWEAMERSSSWRITAPLRSFRLWISRTRDVVLEALGLWTRRSPVGVDAPEALATESIPDAASIGGCQDTVVDGVREWSEYAPLGDRIARAREDLSRSYPVIPRKMLDFSPDELDQRTRRIRFFQQARTPLVSIIIPAANGAKATVECLTSIVMEARYSISYEVIVVDDATNDGTASLLRNVEGITVLSNTSHQGFPRCCNLAAGKARGRFLLFLRNDMQVQEGWLTALVRSFCQHERAGVAGPRIEYSNGLLQEAGGRVGRDGIPEGLGRDQSPADPRYGFTRYVEYCSSGCMLVDAVLFRQLGGFDERYAAAGCEDVDLCFRIREQGLKVVYCSNATVLRHAGGADKMEENRRKQESDNRNVAEFARTWRTRLDEDDNIRIVALYLPQFHSIPENDLWWGEGFTDWRNVERARPNFVGHYQPRKPGELGYYDLNDTNVIRKQAALAREYGVDAFCFYYYWFAGKRLLERPLDRLLDEGIDFPFCVCWANENWTRRWDGRDSEILMAQAHSDDDDTAVIRDLTRYLRAPSYLRVDGKPLLLVYRVQLFPDFLRTSRLWRQECLDRGIGEIHLCMMETFELVNRQVNPRKYGCDAAIEFPPHEMAEPLASFGRLLNPEFRGQVADYRDIAFRFATRPHPGYPRYRGAIAGWDNTARRQNDGLIFVNSSPGAFQAWLESVIRDSKLENAPAERLVFLNAWNEWAEGAYLEPDTVHGHAFLEAVRNARRAASVAGRASPSIDPSIVRQADR